MKSQKIFGLGFGRTGTKSLNHALKELGFASKHWPHDRKTYHELANGIYSLSILKKYDAITDLTISQYYAQLDKEYPDSKFILTVRDRESWSNRWTNSNAKPKDHTSLWRKYNRGVCEMWRKTGKGYRNLLDFRFYVRLLDFPHKLHRIEFLRIASYGVIERTNPDRMSYVYDLHIKNVCEYFKNRPKDLLIMNIFEGDGWEKLCPFLDKPVPDVPFPHIRGGRDISR